MLCKQPQLLALIPFNRLAHLSSGSEVSNKCEGEKMEIVSEHTAVMKKKHQRWTLEPALFLLFFGWYLSVSIVTNQILKQTCIYQFEYSHIVCNQLDDKNATGSIEQEIQPYVANILMTLTILNSIIPMLLSLFLGPWSDRFGRKRVFCAVFLGYNISMGWIMIVSYLSDYIATNNPWNYLFAQLPVMLSGGIPTLVVVILCYVTDQTNESNRSTRMTIIELIIFFGVLVAVAGSSFLLKLTNATAVFFTSFVCISIGTFIVVFLVEESVPMEKDVKLVDQYKELFSPTRIKELYSTCVQPRQFRQRRILWMLISILTLNYFVSNGSHTIFYLFVRQKFGWTLQDLTLYESGSMLMTLFGSGVALVVLKKYFDWSDMSLSVLSFASLLIDGFIKVVATQTWHFYLASGISMFKIVATPMLRSITSTIVSKGELGKVYSITSAFEAISGLGAAPLYTATYSGTLLTFPSAFNLITVVVFATTLMLAIMVGRLLVTSNSNRVYDTKL